MKTIKYRIKIETFKTGRQLFYAQKKVGPIWFYLDYEGSTTSMKLDSWSRDGALERIDKNYEENSVRVSIEFEYIEK